MTEPIEDMPSAQGQAPTVYTAAMLFGGQIATNRITKKDPRTTTMVAAAGIVVQGGGVGSLVVELSGPALAVALWDPQARVAGMGHFLLPSSRSALNPAMVAADPGRYIDSGLACLIERVIKAGGVLTRLVVTMAGGAKVGAAKDLFQVGTRNLTAARKVLWTQQLLISREDVGGQGDRLLNIDTATGECAVEKAETV
jgi:chemotaxis protein CheD